MSKNLVGYRMAHSVSQPYHMMCSDDTSSYTFHIDVDVDDFYIDVGRKKGSNMKKKFLGEAVQDDTLWTSWMT
jgi:hypothetical protein